MRATFAARGVPRSPTADVPSRGAYVLALPRGGPCSSAATVVAASVCPMVDTMAAFPHTSLPPVVALLPSGVAVAAGKTGVVVVVVAATTAEPYALSPPSRIVSSSTALLMPPLLGPGDISGR
jgi:hypothetical protein